MQGPIGGTDPQVDLVGVEGCEIFIESKEEAELKVEELLKEEKHRSDVMSFDVDKMRPLSDSELGKTKLLRSRLLSVPVDNRRAYLVALAADILKLPDAVARAENIYKAFGPRLTLASLPLYAAYRENLADSEFVELLDFIYATAERVGRACVGEFELRNRLSGLDDILIKHNRSMSKWWYHVYGWSNNVGYVGNYPGDVTDFLTGIATDWFQKKELVKTAHMGNADWRGTLRMHGGSGALPPLPDDPAEAYAVLFDYWCGVFVNVVFTKYVEGVSVRDWSGNINYYAAGGATKIVGVSSSDADGMPLTTRKVKGQIPGVLSPEELSGIVNNADNAPQQTIFIKPNETAKFRGVISGDDSLYLQMSFVGYVLEMSVDHKDITSRPTTTFDTPAEFIVSQELFDAERGVSMPLDQSKFDRHVTMREEVTAFGKCIDKAVDLTSDAEAKRAVAHVGSTLLARLPKTQIKIPGGAMLTQLGGLSSGIKWTSLGNSIINFAQDMVAACIAASWIGFNPLVALRVQGDDSRLKFVTSLAGACFYYALQSTGVSVNAAKFFFNAQGDFYLRKLIWHTDGRVFMTGPPSRTARGIVWVDPYSEPDPQVGFLEEAASTWWLLSCRSAAATTIAIGSDVRVIMPVLARDDMSGIASKMFLDGMLAGDAVDRWLITNNAVSNGTGGGFLPEWLGWDVSGIRGNVVYRAAKREYNGTVRWRSGSVMDRWYKRFSPEMRRTLYSAYLSRLGTAGTFITLPGSLKVTEDVAGMGTTLLSNAAMSGLNWLADTSWLDSRTAIFRFGVNIRRGLRSPIDTYARIWCAKHVAGWFEMGPASQSFAMTVAVESDDFKRDWSHYNFRGMSKLAYRVLVEKEFPLARVYMMSGYQASVVSGMSAVSVLSQAREVMVSRGWNVGAALTVRGAIVETTRSLCRSIFARKKNIIYVG